MPSFQQIYSCLFLLMILYKSCHTKASFNLHIHILKVMMKYMALCFCFSKFIHAFFTNLIHHILPSTVDDSIHIRSTCHIGSTIGIFLLKSGHVILRTQLKSMPCHSYYYDYYFIIPCHAYSVEGMPFMATW